MTFTPSSQIRISCRWKWIIRCAVGQLRIMLLLLPYRKFKTYSRSIKRISSHQLQELHLSTSFTMTTSWFKALKPSKRRPSTPTTSTTSKEKTKSRPSLKLKEICSQISSKLCSIRTLLTRRWELLWPVSIAGLHLALVRCITERERKIRYRL